VSTKSKQNLLSSKSIDIAKQIELQPKIAQNLDADPYTVPTVFNMMRMRIRNTGDQVHLFLSILLLLPYDQIQKQCRLMRDQIWIKNTEKNTISTSWLSILTC
jgi:hypothetical protein